MGDAVKEVFIEEMSRRLDAIYEAAKELGGAVGVQIRELASVSILPEDVVPPMLVLTVTTSHEFRDGEIVEKTNEREPLGDFLRVGDTGDALPSSYCRRCPGTPLLMTWIRGTGYRCSRCDAPGTRRTVLREVTATGELLDLPGDGTGRTS